jgi:hypothetical protein
LKRFVAFRYRWSLWLGLLFCFVAVALYPVSIRLTRVLGLTLFVALWLGLIFLNWNRRNVRITWFVGTVLCLGFLCFPGRPVPEVTALRRDYVTALRRCEGIAYYWGGENCIGIDCSGLIRRGLIDALFLRGIQALNPGLVRYALAVWWNDCSAKALGEEYQQITTHLFDASSVNDLDYSRIRAGDIVVTQGGAHVMAYLGENRWIEADPGVGRVICVGIPSADNSWFKIPVRVLRWRILNP